MRSERTTTPCAPPTSDTGARTAPSAMSTTPYARPTSDRAGQTHERQPCRHPSGPSPCCPSSPPWQDARPKRPSPRCRRNRPKSGRWPNASPNRPRQPASCASSTVRKTSRRNRTSTCSRWPNKGLAASRATSPSTAMSRMKPSGRPFCAACRWPKPPACHSGSTTSAGILREARAISPCAATRSGPRAAC